MSKTIIMGKESIYRGTLLLVNERYPLRDAGASDLAVVDVRFPDIRIRQEAADALVRLLDSLSARDSIIPVSGYRSQKEQEDIYTESQKQNGEEFTLKYVALPGHSEHQTGLAIDLGQNQENIDFIRPEFPYEGICQEFRTAAPGYGFIERYGRKKEKITGIAHEPWHFRYVGFPHAQIMTEQELAMEEYAAHIRSYRFGCGYVYRQQDVEAEVYFVPSEGRETEVPVPENGMYQISGNNIDGFIVTVLRGGV